MPDVRVNIHGIEVALNDTYGELDNMAALAHVMAGDLQRQYIHIQHDPYGHDQPIALTEDDTQE
jgi:hypothetical protein